MRKLTLIPCLLLCCLLLITNGRAQSLADEQSFVSDIQKEIQHQYQQYRNREVPICSLAVRIETTDDYLIESSMGSLMSNQHHNQRTLSINMLVGDMQKGDITAGSSAGKAILLPLDYNIQAFSHILSREIQNVYDLAEKEFLDRKDRERVEKSLFEPKIFPEEEIIENEITLPKNADISTESCQSLLNECSALWNTFGNNIQGNASIHYACVRWYDFHDNGSVVTNDLNYTTLTLLATLTDKDGKRIPIEKIILSEYPADLPEKNLILQEETAMYEQLQLLADAPDAIAGFYPVLLSNQAAAIALYTSRTTITPDVCKLLTMKEDVSHFSAIATSDQKEDYLLLRLKQNLKNQKKDYGYWVKSVRLSEKDGIVPQELYRIYPDERANELVRGNVAIQPNAQLWAQISACGDLSDCAIAANGHSQAFPVTCCAPSVLCDMLYFHEIPQPLQVSLLTPFQNDNILTEQPFPSLASQVAQNEISTFFEDTNLLDFPKPYDVEYLFTDAVTYAIQSSLGSTLVIDEHPSRSVSTRVLVGNDKFNNEHLSTSQKTPSYNLPLDNNPANMAQTLHRATDNAYRQALLDYSQKNRLLSPEQQKNWLPDRSEAKRQSHFYEEAVNPISLSLLQTLANDLSAQFTPKADELLNSGVNISVFQSTAHFFSAQSIQYAQSFNIIQIKWFAETVTDDGDTLRDCSLRIFRNIDEITDLSDEITAMAERLVTFKHAVRMSEGYYDGPILLSNEAVTTLLTHTLLGSESSLIATHKNANCSLNNGWDLMKNKRVASSILCVSANYDKIKYQNTPLIGYYSIDAEGVPVMRETELIHEGILTDMLSSRSPSQMVKYSNGHQRLALRNNKLVACTGAGILQVDGSRALNEDVLLKDLLKQAKAAGWKYTYQIVKFTDGEKEFNLYPIYAYCIKVSNGKRTPVRLTTTEQIYNELLLRATGVSSEKMVCNMLVPEQGMEPKTSEFHLNGIPTSIIAPTHIILNHFFLLPGK